MGRCRSKGRGKRRIKAIEETAKEEKDKDKPNKEKMKAYKIRKR